MSERADLTNKLVLTREYLTPYDALIRNDVVMGVSRYFLERWVPLLGTNAATVVNTLRQLNYHCHNDAVTISGNALAREAAMSRRHLYTCLEALWMPAFIRIKSGERMRNENGKITQKANNYFIRMDDPLNPADADHLCQILTNLADTPLDAAQRALEHDPRDLWALNPKLTPERFTQPGAITARDVLQCAFPTWTPTTKDTKRQFAQLAEALHRHITLIREDGKTSKIIVPQYFRKRWWKLLGHDLAWTYLWLRGYVYDNPVEGIRRDTCWLPSLNTLLDSINRPREWWRRNVEKKKSAETWSLSDFFKQQVSQKGRDPANPQWVARQFWIALDIPIAPEDQEQYMQLLDSWQDKIDKQDPVPDPSSGSATFKHTGREEVSHIQTHWNIGGQPHSNTPAERKSATFKHTGTLGVSHIQTQGSATYTHRDSESNQVPVKNKHCQNINKHPKLPNFDTEVVNNADDAEIETMDQQKKASLIDQIAEKLDGAPETCLYACATMELWFQQTWIEPIRPHTPAWNAIKTGQILPCDMIALMLAIWADTAIKHPPRYLSWLIQRWQKQPDIHPVDQWERWQALAELPIGQWLNEGQRDWLELAPRENRALPFGLDTLCTSSPEKNSLLQLAARQIEIDEFNALRVQSQLSSQSEQVSNGLDERWGMNQRR